MRTRHVLAVVAVLVVGLALKQFVFQPTKAEAEIERGGIDVMQMQVDRPNLQADHMHDMQTVFTENE